jgi:Peptidase family M23
MKNLFLAITTVMLIAALAAGYNDDAKSEDTTNPTTEVENPGVLTAVAWSVVATPVFPVTGSDGLIHLGYELQFTNITGSAVTVKIDSVEVIDPLRDNSVISSVKVFSIDGADITYKLRNYDVPVTLDVNNYSNILGPGQFGVMYMNVTFNNIDEVPQFLGHRVTASLPEIEGAQPITAIGGFTEVSSDKAIVVSPPLKGDRWIDADGCCSIIGAHRFTINTINGKLRIAERFAIDFVQLNSEGKLFEGDPSDLNNWHYYKSEIFAAAPGMVIEAVNGLPDQPPGQLPPDTTIVTAGGNHVIIDMGGGRFALYAHMIPGSVVVNKGDFVERGQLLGLLGNSGNTDGPHLHFHVMDNAPALNSNGLPYVFDKWEFQGHLVGTLEEINTKFFSGQAIEIDFTGSGNRTEQLPLTNDVIGFK